MFFITSANFSWMGENLSENEKQNRFRLHFRWLNKNFAKEIKRKNLPIKPNTPQSTRSLAQSHRYVGKFLWMRAGPATTTTTTKF